MGEPAVPTEAERTATLEIARAIVAAETNDEEWPKISEGRARYNPFCGELDEPSSTAVFRLAQDLVTSTDERTHAISVIQKLLASAVPNRRKHPTMFAAWENAKWWLAVHATKEQP